MLLYKGFFPPIFRFNETSKQEKINFINFKLNLSSNFKLNSKFNFKLNFKLN